MGWKAAMRRSGSKIADCPCSEARASLLPRLTSFESCSPVFAALAPAVAARMGSTSSKPEQSKLEGPTTTEAEAQAQAP